MSSALKQQGTLEEVRYLLLDNGLTIGCFKRVWKVPECTKTQSPSTTEAVILEPTGHCFTWIRSDGTMERHLTPYVRHELKHLIRLTVDFRNRYSSTADPYLHSNFLSPESPVVKKNKLLSYIRWPMMRINPKRIRNKDGSFTLRALDQTASLTLSCHGKIVLIKSLLHVPQEKDTMEYQYTWIEQSFSVHDAPKAYKHPLQILLSAWKSYNFSAHSETPDEDTLEEASSAYIMTATAANAAKNARPSWSAFNVIEKMPLTSRDILRLSSSAAISCTSLPVAVKVEWKKEGVYRLVRNTGEVSVQVHVAADDSVIDLRGRFFDHVSVQNPLKINSYLKETIPPTLAFLGHDLYYSIAPICSNATALRDLALDLASTKAIRPIDKDVGLCSDVVEEQKTEDGLFTAFRDGRVRIIFADRTIVQLDALHQRCTFILPNGKRDVVLCRSPMHYRSYVMVTLDFAKWAFSTEEERIEDAQRQRYRKQLVETEVFRCRYTSQLALVDIDRNRDRREVVPITQHCEFLDEAKSTYSSVQDVEAVIQANQEHIDKIRRLLAQS